MTYNGHFKDGDISSHARSCFKKNVTWIKLENLLVKNC